MWHPSLHNQTLRCTKSFWTVWTHFSLQRNLAPLPRRLTPVLTSSYTTHRQTQHVEKLASPLDFSPVLLQGFHWFGLELMWRYMIHHLVGLDWSAGFLRLRLFCFPVIYRAKKDAIVAQTNRKLRETPCAFISWRPAEGWMKEGTFWKTSRRLPLIHIKMSFQEQDIRFTRHLFVSIFMQAVTGMTWRWRVSFLFYRTDGLKSSWETNLEALLNRMSSSCFGWRVAMLVFFLTDTDSFWEHALRLLT